MEVGDELHRKLLILAEKRHVNEKVPIRDLFCAKRGQNGVSFGRKRTILYKYRGVMISAEQYNNLAVQLAESAALGLPVVMITVEQTQREDDSTAERLQFYSASNTYYEAEGMLLHLSRMVDEGQFRLSEEETVDDDDD